MQAVVPIKLNHSDTAEENREETQKGMALVTSQTVNDGPLFAEVDMGADYNATTVRATIVQASTIFYDTPATLGPPFLLLLLSLAHVVSDSIAQILISSS